MTPLTEGQYALLEAIESMPPGYNPEDVAHELFTDWTHQPPPPALPHVVTEEPPVGAVIRIDGHFASGGGWAIGWLLRTPAGWSASPWEHSPRTWADLTDVDAWNHPASLSNHPASRSRVVAVTATQVAGPTTAAGSAA